MPNYFNCTTIAITTINCMYVPRSVRIIRLKRTVIILTVVVVKKMVSLAFVWYRPQSVRHIWRTAIAEWTTATMAVTIISTKMIRIMTKDSVCWTASTEVIVIRNRIATVIVVRVRRMMRTVRKRVVRAAKVHVCMRRPAIPRIRCKSYRWRRKWTRLCDGGQKLSSYDHTINKVFLNKMTQTHVCH